MGKKEFANQQPTQNLVGRGRRGVHNTAHTEGNEVHSQLSASLPLLAIHRAEVCDLMGGIFPLPPPFKLTKKHGLPQSQHSAGQVPLAANVQPIIKTHTKESSIQVQSCESHGNSRRWVMCRAGIFRGFFLECLQWACQSHKIRVSLSAVGNEFPVCSSESVFQGPLQIKACGDFLTVCSPRCPTTKASPSVTAWRSGSQHPIC